MEAVSVYLHVPFCRHRCAYCDFNTYAGQESRIPAYVSALCDEIRQASAASPSRESVHTVFFGGGTPSLLGREQIAAILETIQSGFDVLPGAEITLEANPGTTSRAYLTDLKAIGVNRLSMGMQTAQPEELRLIERQHNFEDVIRSVEWARQAGFDNLSLDLLFAIPGQTMETWKQSLERALELKTEHLSLYSLTIEEGTPFYHWMERGLFRPADEDLTADMMEYAHERLENAGFQQYEISNWARRSGDLRFECRHNLQYWRNRPYYGFGAGAHACLAGYRLANARPIGDYIKHMGQEGAPVYPFGAATVESNTVDEGTSMEETMMLGLRLTHEGVSRTDFRARYGKDVRDLFEARIDKLMGQGLLEWAPGGDVLRLTLRGRFLGNRVFMEFVGE